MRIIFRFGGIAWLAAAIVILAVLPFATSFVEQWSRRDVELRSHLVFNSVRDQVTGLLARNDAQQVAGLFERIASDERGGEARNYLFLSLAGVAFGAAALAAMIAARIMWRWLASIRQALESARAGNAQPDVNA